ncbi:MAG: CapA family protein [Deltaproteobacteria bacterium]|nr:CapA family protein [Deltaproteobacteria bacterium]
MDKESITLLGTGDLLVDRERPETIFQHVKNVLCSADITFGNSEQTYAEGGYLIRGHGTNSESRNLSAVRSAGFDVISLANNHTLDWGREVLLETMAFMEKTGLPYVGVGKNIKEARRPVILERKGTKVGFLAYSSVHPKGFEATENSPGLTPVRVWTIYEQTDYQPGTPPRIITIPYEEDLRAMVEDIQKIKSHADIVVVSMHWGIHVIPRVIPMYCFTVGHAAIDAGADMILGCHPHICKGIEMYKGKPIFYSTGNFAAEIGPYQVNHCGGEFAHEMVKKYGAVPDPECPAFNMPREARSTMIVKAVIEDGKIKRLSYIPCFVNKDSEPEIVSEDNPLGQEVFDYIQEISQSENLEVNFKWDNNEVLILP